MTARLVIERPCEHGMMYQHGVRDVTTLMWLEEECPGGSRQEVDRERIIEAVANACASHDMQSGPFDMLAELSDDMAAAYRTFAEKHVDALLFEEEE